MKSRQYIKKSEQTGFTLIEVLIVVSIIAILASIAYPSYQASVKKTNRTEMMASIVEIASDIEASKLAKGNYSSVVLPTYLNDFYTVTTSSPLAANWVITATPKTAGKMNGDGVLTYTFNHAKCRNISETDKKCGYAKEWNE